MAPATAPTAARPHPNDPGVRIVDTPLQSQVDRHLPVDGPLLLGREPGPKGFALLDPRVSGVHLTLYPSDGGCLRFRDMGSTNGTFHNGRRTPGGPLAPGDTLRLGSTLFVATGPGAPTDPTPLLPGLLGAAAPFRAAVLTARAAALSRTPLLLLGEPATGKSTLARALHAASTPAPAPFASLDCATLAAPDAPARLLGPAGLLRTLPPGATLFLDALGDLPAPLQPLLHAALRASPAPHIVAAAAPDLPLRAAQGRFLPALLAHFAPATVPIPPLRDRREDLLPLARLLAGLPPDRVPHADPLFDPDLAEVLVLYPWPHNLRELRQVIDWLALAPTRPLPFDRLARRIIDAAVPPLGDPAPSPAPDASRTAPLKVAEAHRRHPRPSRDELHAALVANDFNISAVARAFDRDRKQIYRWVELYALPLPAGSDDR